MKRLLSLVAVLMLLLAAQSVLADDCVDVDIELTPQVTVGPGNFGEGYFELTNCGDTAALINLSFTVDLGIGQPFEVHAFPVPVGAGETISREFIFPAPPVAAGVNVTFCVTATSGTAEASDCATVMFVGDSDSSGEFRRFGMQMVAAGSSDCLDFDFEISDTVTTTPGDFFADAYFELTNCGDTATMVSLTLSIDVLGSEPLVTIPVRVGAGETVSRTFQFPVPPAVPAGDYAITVTAASGDAMVSKTEVVTVLAGDLGGGGVSANTLSAVNHPNPFNPSTQISFNLPQASQVNLTIYNMLGQKVRTLIADDYMSAGEHTVMWDGSNGDGGHVASGIYLYRLSTEVGTITKKMLLAK